MPAIQILTETELRGCVALDHAALACVEGAFAALATQAVAMPPILRLDIPDHHGEVDVKTAYVPGIESFAIKISPGFFDNPKLGLPSVNGLMVLFSATTGLVEALLLDNGYLTDVRTAAAGGIAARWLARDNARSAGIIGAGVQGRLQLEALTLVRDIQEAAVWARDPAQADHFAHEMSAKLGLPMRAEPSAEALVRACDIVVTTTPSTQPLVMAEWLRAGQHVTAMGSDAPHKNELAPAVLARADFYVCDRQSQCAALGELHHAIASGLLTADQRFAELGQVIAGTAPGRVAAEQVTVCDLTGTGVQDTAIATFARHRAAAAGAGTVMTS